jgi:hypothetical protein
MNKFRPSLASPDPRLLWAKAEAEFRRMSDKEKAQTLVSAGLFTTALKPLKRYRPLFPRGAKAQS